MKRPELVGSVYVLVRFFIAAILRKGDDAIGFCRRRIVSGQGLELDWLHFHTSLQCCLKTTEVQDQHQDAEIHSDPTKLLQKDN